jgi:cytochrome c551/c552
MRSDRTPRWLLAIAAGALACVATVRTQQSIGQERAVPQHLRDGDEFTMPVAALVDYGRQLFIANWTEQDGAGRPRTTGTGARIVDASHALKGTRSGNRVSGPDANACLGCHNRPAGLVGGAGDVVAAAFEGAERFDFVTFDRGGTTLQTVGDVRATPSLWGAGYVEMLAREMTAELRRTRDSLTPGQSTRLVAKGVSFGTLSRKADGTWVTRAVEGLPPQSLRSAGGDAKPSLVIRPWQRSGTAVSLREVVNTSLNQHHGIQTTERFGVNTDPDGDGVTNEMTRADVTALTAFIATLPVPRRAAPTDPATASAVASGEQLFKTVQCTRCHVPSLPLERSGWMYSEPGPYNGAGNLRRGETRTLTIDLTSASLPAPRLIASRERPDMIDVPLYTDFKLHDITDPTDRAAQEPIDMNQPYGSKASLAGNRRFLTRRLWGIASEPAHFHDGLLTTLRASVLAHDGEARPERLAFERLGAADQSAVIEFLKSLQVAR